MSVHTVRDTPSQCKQVQGQGTSGPQYKGVLDVMKHLYKEGGMRSIFRGAGATLVRDGPGSAAYDGIPSLAWCIS